VVQHACAAGCAYCCHLTVEASAPEVFLIAAHLKQNSSAERLAAIQERVEQTAAKVRGLSPEDRVRAALPCALLENGQCAAYAARPLGCRSWNSRDAGACAKVMQEGGGDLRPVQDQRPFGIESEVRAAGRRQPPIRVELGAGNCAERAGSAGALGRRRGCAGTGPRRWASGRLSGTQDNFCRYVSRLAP